MEPKKDNFDDEEYATLTTGYEPMYNAYDDAYDDAGYHEVSVKPLKTFMENQNGEISRSCYQETGASPIAG